MGKPFFITLEGIEGVGKSTAISVIAKTLTTHQLDYTLTREPGGTAVGEKIRELLLIETAEPLLAESECLLLFAARHQHIQHVVLPNLAQGKSVICDRFTDATYAYQGGGRGVPQEHIAYLEHWIQDDLQPDLTLLLDASVETALERAYARGQADRIEAESHEFFHTIRETYLQRAQRYSQRYRIIDANQPLNTVTQQLTQTLESWLDEQ